MSQQPAGWYDDPSNPDMLRYWDGVTWSNHTAPRKSPTASSSSGGPDYQGQRPIVPAAPRQSSQAPPPPMPQGSGWQDQPQQPQQPQQGWQGQQGQFGQAPQYPDAAGSAGSANWMHSIKTTSDGVPLASWGRRLGAWAIDGVILVVLSVILSRIVAPEIWTAFSQAAETITQGPGNQAAADAAANDFAVVVTASAAKVGLSQFLLVSLYCIGFWTTIAQTPGKMAVGISVRRMDRTGPLDVMTAVRRRLLSLLQLVPIVSFLWPILDLIDGLWPLWDDKRQTLHDKVAQTQVVMGKQPKSGSTQRN